MSDFDGTADDSFSNLVGASGGGFVDETNDWLVLTTNVDNQLGTGYVPDLTPGAAATSISASFSINQSLATDADEADGTAFFFGGFANDTTALADGFALTAGLRVRFHIENNSFGTNPDESITIHYNNSEIFTQQFALTTDAIDFRDASFSVNAAGLLNLSYDGAAIITDQAIAGWAPEDNWQFALTARTGGRNADQFIDNLSLTEAIPEPGSVALLGLTGIALLARRRRR